MADEVQIKDLRKRGNGWRFTVVQGEQSQAFSTTANGRGLYRETPQGPKFVPGSECVVTTTNKKGVSKFLVVLFRIVLIALLAGALFGLYLMG